MRFLTFILALMTYPALCQDTAIVRTFGGPYNDYGNDIIQTSDGGYAIIGTTGSYWQGQSNMYLLKINSDLEKEWSQVFGGNNVEWGQSLIDVDDGYLLLGYSNSFGAGGYDVYLVKCDYSGTLLWQKTYGGSDWDFGYSLIQHNNRIYIAGESWSFSNGASDGYLLEIDAAGNELWSGHFGGTEEEALYSMFLGANGLQAVGYNSSVEERSKLMVVEWDDNNSTTEHIIGEPNKSYVGRSGVFHSNGSYFYTGSIQYDDQKNYMILRTDTDFNIVAGVNEKFGLNEHPDIAHTILEVGNEHLTMVGESNSYTASVGAFIVRSEISGQYLTGPTFGDNQSDIGRKLILNADDELMMIGETNSYGIGNFDVYLIQFPNDSVIQAYDLDIEHFSDDLLTNLEEESPPSAIQFYPNPATDEINFTGDTEWQSIAFFDMRGRLILRSRVDTKNGTINIRELPAGAYIVELTGRSESRRTRLIVQ